MKKTILNYLLYGIITLDLASCRKKTESQNEFICSNGEKKVEMVLENNAEFLIIGKPTRANFDTEI